MPNAHTGVPKLPARRRRTSGGTPSARSDLSPPLNRYVKVGAVLAPVVAPDHNLKLLAYGGVKRMDNPETSRRIVPIRRI